MERNHGIFDYPPSLRVDSKLTVSISSRLPCRSACFEFGTWRAATYLSKSILFAGHCECAAPTSRTRHLSAVPTLEEKSNAESLPFFRML